MDYSFWWYVTEPATYYFLRLLDPFVGNPLSFIPPISVVCLLVGALLAVIKKQFSLLIFLGSPIATHVLFLLAALLGGDFPLSVLFFSSFFITQFVFCCYLVFQLRGIRVAASLLSIFSLSYAFFISTWTFMNLGHWASREFVPPL